MSDSYREILIDRKPGPMDGFLKVVMILLTGLALAAVLLTPWASIFLLVLCIGDYFLFPALRVEFEYLYVDGEMYVDKIMSKSKRKRVGSYDVKDIELLAPWDSHEMDYYRKSQKETLVDYSSHREGAAVYAMVYHSEKGIRVVLFEPDEFILNDIRRIAPRKVHIGK